MRGHRHITAWVLVLLSSALVAAVAARDGQQRRAPTTEREVLQKFQSQIDAYMALHNRLEKESPPLTGADDPEQVRASQKALAAKIRAARRNPAPGAIFTPETRTVFRRILRRELQGPLGAELQRALKDDAPPRILLRVHAEYPASWPVASVPPRILAILPKLPEDLDYRFVAYDMILLDVHANLIIDFIRDAIR